MSGAHRVLLIGWAAAVIACDGHGTDPPVRAEQLGTPVTAPGIPVEQSPLAWSGDGSEVFFLGNGFARDLLAVRVSDGAIRTVHADTTTSVSTARVLVSPDGRWIYRVRWLVDQGSSYLLDRVSADGGPAEILAHNLSFGLGQAAVSPDGRLVAYATVGEPGDPNDARVSTRDTLVVHDLDSGEREAVGFGIPLVFSPDGNRLAYDERPCLEGGEFNNPCDTYILDLRSGARQAVPWDKDDIGKQVWWNDSGLQALASTHDFDSPTSPLQWIVRNLTRQTVRVIFSLELYQEYPAPGWYAHSADGTRVGGWYLHDDGTDIFEGFRVTDLRTRQDSLVVVNRTAQAWSPAFSRDGRRIAYLIGRRIHVQPLPDSL